MTFLVQADAIVKGVVPSDAQKATFQLGYTWTQHADVHVLSVDYTSGKSGVTIHRVVCETRTIPNWFMDLASVMIRRGIITLDVNAASPSANDRHRLRRLS